jgi:predicted DNA-binding antitoxin AbrB/MazE fold protein
MRDQIEVIYENGVFRPLAALPRRYQEHQRLTVTIEGPNGVAPWLADADPTVSLDVVRQALGKIPGTLAELVRAERDER